VRGRRQYVQEEGRERMQARFSILIRWDLPEPDVRPVTPESDLSPNGV
jgi:hypothetical protein